MASKKKEDVVDGENATKAPVAETAFESHNDYDPA